MNTYTVTLADLTHDQFVAMMIDLPKNIAVDVVTKTGSVRTRAPSNGARVMPTKTLRRGSKGKMGLPRLIVWDALKNPMTRKALTTACTAIFLDKGFSKSSVSPTISQMISAGQIKVNK